MTIFYLLSCPVLMSFLALAMAPENVHKTVSESHVK